MIYAQNDTDAQLGVLETRYERRDLHQRDVVNHAISVQQSTNTVSAIEYLKSHDIDPRVIERVLLEPHRRRCGPGHTLS